MKKNFRRTGKPTLPEIQEEGLLTPLRRGASFSAYAVAHHKLVTPSLRDLETGSDHNLHSNVEMAAALVDQAMQGRYLPLAVVYHKDYESAKQAFLLHHQLYLARGIVYLILMLLPFFEIPAWCNGEIPNPCGDFDGSAYALSRLPYIHPWSSLVIEVCTIHIKPYN
jgi:two pore calcium channel protein